MSEEQATELPRAYVVPQGGLAKWQDGAARKRLEEEIMKWVAGQVSVWGWYKEIYTAGKLILILIRWRIISVCEEVSSSSRRSPRGKLRANTFAICASN
jgi:hypothetical protein